MMIEVSLQFQQDPSSMRIQPAMSIESRNHAVKVSTRMLVLRLWALHVDHCEEGDGHGDLIEVVSRVA